MMKTWEEGEEKAVNAPLKPSKPKREGVGEGEK